MEKKHRDLLIKNNQYLEKHLDMPELIDHMLGTRLLSVSDKDRLEVISIARLGAWFAKFFVAKQSLLQLWKSVNSHWMIAKNRRKI